MDENDCLPIVEIPKIVEITEYHDVNDIIASVKVSDADDPRTPNGKTHISIKNGKKNGNI